MKSYAERRDAEAKRRARESRHRGPEDHQRLFNERYRLLQGIPLPSQQVRDLIREQPGQIESR